MFVKNERAFTLIELLVVVLIIGVLSAIALPQYQKATEKAKAVQAWVLLKQVADAQQAYYLANGSYASKFADLGIEIPLTGNTKWRNSGITDTLSSQDWSMQIENSQWNTAVYIGQLRGSYKGAGFMVELYTPETVMKPYEHKMICVEMKSGGIIFGQESGLSAGDYCSKIFRGSSIWDASVFRHYSLP